MPWAFVQLLVKWTLLKGYQREPFQQQDCRSYQRKLTKFGLTLHAVIKPELERSINSKLDVPSVTSHLLFQQKSIILLVPSYLNVSSLLWIDSNTREMFNYSNGRRNNLQFITDLACNEGQPSFRPHCFLF